MKFLKYFFIKVKKFLKGITISSIRFLSIIFIIWMLLIAEGFTLEDFGIEGFTLNPNDYCNLTDIDYTAVLHDDPDGSASVEITEYLTFDVHASSEYNTFKELWRELPEDYVDGLSVTYDVKSVSQVLDNGEEIPYTKTYKMYWEDSDYTPDSTMRWHHSKGSGRYPDNDESLLIYIPWTYREKMTFKIVYTMNNAALRYRDCSELYLSMYSGDTITKLNSYKAKILIPDEIMPSTYYSYTFGTANSRLPYIESDDLYPNYHTFLMDLDKSDLKFNYHNRYIEFCLLAYGEDKHIFTQYAPDNLYSDEDALQECISENEFYETQNEKYNTYKTLLFILSVALSVLIIRSTIRKCKKVQEQCNIYQPEVDYEYFREIPSDLDPIFASELVFMKDPFNANQEKQEEYAAILLSLVRKKYVKIIKNDYSREWSTFNTKIELQPLRTYYKSQEYTDLEHYSAEPIEITVNTNTSEPLEPLTTSERLYLQLLERHARIYGNSITVFQLQQRIDSDYEYTNSFVKDMEKKPALESGVLQGYFRQTEYDAPKKELTHSAQLSLSLSIFLLIFVNIYSFFTPMALSFGAYTILGITLLWKYFYQICKASTAILFTQYGIDEQAKWCGLYNFLNSDTLINEKGVDDLILWEKYLIYATAFGISEKVIKAIKIHAVELNIDNSAVLNHHSYIHSSSFRTTSRAFGRSIHTSTRGGGFGGHGYGGGGRGGGGRWWRTLISHKINKRRVHFGTLLFHFNISFSFRSLKLIFNSFSTFSFLKVL